MKTHYINGIIRTMDDGKVFDSMVVEDGIITALGSSIPADGEGEVCDLKGKTVLPAFIDAHSHITSVAMSMLQVDLLGCKDIAEIQQRLTEYAEKQNIHEMGYVSAVGYDHNMLTEKRHPTRDEIDAVVSDVPVVLIHQSNHFGVFNSKAIELLELDTRDGYMQETDFVQAVRKMPMPGISSIIRCYERAQEYYSSYGICRVQDGMIVKEMLPIYKALLHTDKLFLNIMGYADVNERAEICAELEGINSLFSISGYKIILDGSPQGKTAWTREPYLGTENDCSGALVSDEQLQEAIKAALADNKQLIAHCNGDAAAAQFIRAAKAFDIHKIRENRPVIVHAQLLGTDQLDDVRELGMIPSFFIAHVYHYGDIHLENLGQARGEKISPAASALAKGIEFTFHQDSPVIPPDMFETIWCSVARETRSGKLLGADERIDVYEAVKAVTINAAKQYGIENSAGSLAVGKKADFILLDRDIFTAATEDIRNTVVVQTYKDGRLIYSRS